MDGTPILIKFDGGDADSQSIDMRLLGESLQGFGRTISDAIIITSARRMPKKGERAPLVVKATEPRSGTVNIPALIQDASGLLALGWNIMGLDAQQIVSDWVKGVLLFHAGKRSEAELAMEHMAQVALATVAAQDRSDERRHIEASGMQDLVRACVERLGPAAVQAAAPVGPSVRRLWFTAGSQPKVTIETETADQIREQGWVEFGPMQTYRLRTDGFTFHTRKLSVEHPERPGYLLAEVEDPVAEVESNPYAAAVQRKALIEVRAKAGYRNGKLERLVILDFAGEIGEAA
jgi:hypothetical protein